MTNKFSYQNHVHDVKYITNRRYNCSSKLRDTNEPNETRWQIGHAPSEASHRKPEGEARGFSRWRPLIMRVLRSKATKDPSAKPSGFPPKHEGKTRVFCKNRGRSEALGSCLYNKICLHGKQFVPTEMATDV